MNKFSPEKCLPERKIEEITRKEKLEINPFSEILTEEEFMAAREKGKDFLENYIREKDRIIGSQLDKDNFWTAYLDRMDLNEVEGKIVQGKITEDYRETVISQARTILGTQEPQKREIAEKFFEKIESIDPEWDEKLDSNEIFGCYENDSSGKNIIEYIAGKKAYYVARKIDPALSRDIIATDTGVFVRDKNLEAIKNPDRGTKETVKPSHIWLRKPETPGEMKQMLRNISGKDVEIVTAYLIAYKILKEGPWFFEKNSQELMLSIRKLQKEEIESFVNRHFKKGRDITGGVDYATYGKEILEDPRQIQEEVISIVKGAPIEQIRKSWAEVQIVKRSAQMEIKKRLENPT